MYLNEADCAAWAAGGSQIVADVTFSGDQGRLGALMDEYINQGVSELAVMTAGPDIPGELKAFAQALDVARRPSRTAPENPHPHCPSKTGAPTPRRYTEKERSPWRVFSPATPETESNLRNGHRPSPAEPGPIGRNPEAAAGGPDGIGLRPQSSRRTDHEQHLSRGRGCGLETRRHR